MQLPEVPHQIIAQPTFSSHLTSLRLFDKAFRTYQSNKQIIMDSFITVAIAATAATTPPVQIENPHQIDYERQGGSAGGYCVIA